MIYPNEAQTAEEVAQHYNDLDHYYRKLWGEHVHHGFWQNGKESVEEATQSLIDLVVEAAKIEEDTKVLDVGCGYGATSRYLAHDIGALVTALTVSKSQWQYARSHDPESSNPKYILADFLHNTMPSDSYDVIISIESSEHMEDKEKFFSEVHRLLKPGGRFVTCAWLAKESPNDKEVKNFLEPICREGRLPHMGSESEYRSMMETVGLSSIAFRDISSQVKKTWAICAWRAAKAFLSDKSLRRYLLDKTSSERLFAKTLVRIWAAYNKKIMRYGLFSAEKKQ